MLTNQIDSAFQAQEYLKALYRHHTTSPEDPARTIPLKRETAEALCEPPSGCDESVWLFELTCLLVRKLNLLIRALFTCDPPCSVQTCDEMRASEWQYLCAVHDPPKSCSAIDYCCHTMEWAERTLTNPELFSSRLMQEGLKETRGGQVQEEPIGFRHISNIVRRLYRLFAHAWFEHRPVFWQLENGVGLYTVSLVYHSVHDHARQLTVFSFVKRCRIIMA